MSRHHNQEKGMEGGFSAYISPDLEVALCCRLRERQQPTHAPLGQLAHFIEEPLAVGSLWRGSSKVVRKDVFEVMRHQRRDGPGQVARQVLI